MGLMVGHLTASTIFALRETIGVGRFLTFYENKAFAKEETWSDPDRDSKLPQDRFQGRDSIQLKNITKILTKNFLSKSYNKIIKKPEEICTQECRFMGKKVRENRAFFVAPPRAFPLSLLRVSRTSLPKNIRVVYTRLLFK